MIIDSIIVLYNPDEASILENIKIIASKTTCCYVIVNSCDDNVLREISLFPGVIIINNHQNIGLSKSLNIGIKQVLKNNADGVFLFDQDSLPAENFFDNILKSYRYLINNRTEIGAIGGIIHDEKTGKKPIKLSDQPKEVEIIITSGCFIPTKAIKNIGLMDETFFIDYIDYEWCFRARSKGYKIFVSQNATLFHNLGDNMVGILNIKKPIHNNVLRHYHIIRNQLIILCRDYIPLKWRILHFFKVIYRIPGYIIYSSNRRNTAMNIKNAIIAFIKLKDKNKYNY